MIVLLLALLVAALSGWLIEAVAGGAIDRAVSAFRELIGGWRPDGWPRGVQEEDRDRPWGSGTSPITHTLFQRLIEPAAHAVATRHVRGRTRPR
jgi:hypothetical protein